MTGQTVDSIVCTAQREFAKIVKASLRRESLSRVAAFASRSERPFVNILMTGRTLRIRELVNVVHMALIAGHPNMLSIQTESGAAIVVKFDVVVGRGRVATRALLT